MSHSLTKVWIHAIFRTKNSSPLITKDFESKLYKYLIDMLTVELSCVVKIINGTSNHIHILFLLNPHLALKDVMHRIKGSSSHWINQNDFMKNKFAWQIGYGAFSVSESKLNVVELYIKNQKEHHKSVTFSEEYETFLKKHGLDHTENG